jgi:hypothetical protein
MVSLHTKGKGCRGLWLTSQASHDPVPRKLVIAAE